MYLHSEEAVSMTLAHRKAMAETRKLAAILAADVAGYSKLASADEERTLARLRARDLRCRRPKGAERS